MKKLIDTATAKIEAIESQQLLTNGHVRHCRHLLTQAETLLQAAKIAYDIPASTQRTNYRMAWQKWQNADALVEAAERGRAIELEAFEKAAAAYEERLSAQGLRR